MEQPAAAWVWYRKLGQHLLSEISSVIHCFIINYRIIHQNTKISGYLHRNTALPNKITIIITYYIQSTLLAVNINSPHLCVNKHH